MALLIRCQKCRRFFSPENEACPKCEKPWNTRGARKSFYTDFTWAARRNRVRLPARDLVHARQQDADFDPGEWLRSRREKKGRTVTVEEAYRQWLEHSKIFGCRKRRHVENRPWTIRSKQTTFEKHTLPLLGREPIQEITTERILETIRAWMEAPRTSPGTINLRLGHLKTFFRWCRRRGFILTDPTDSDDIGPQEMQPKEKARLSADQIYAIIDFLRSRMEIPRTERALMEFWLWTGLRAWSEAGRLRWDWIDFGERLLTIPAEYTKGRRRIRRALPDEAWSILEEMRLNREDGNPYVFPSRTGRPYWDLKATMKKLAEHVGIPKLTPRDFRHNYVSHTERENALATMQVIGHSSLGIQSRYFHMSEDMMRAFENRIARGMTRVQSVEPGNA